MRGFGTDGERSTSPNSIFEWKRFFGVADKRIRKQFGRGTTQRSLNGWLVLP